MRQMQTRKKVEQSSALVTDAESCIVEFGSVCAEQYELSASHEVP